MFRNSKVYTSKMQKLAYEIYNMFILWMINSLWVFKIKWFDLCLYLKTGVKLITEQWKSFLSYNFLEKHYVNIFEEIKHSEFLFLEDVSKIKCQQNKKLFIWVNSSFSIFPLSLSSMYILIIFHFAWMKFSSHKLASYSKKKKNFLFIFSKLF